jgi:chemotaxis regulatin CheY-phosphate phosphatase CheZ
MIIIVKNEQGDFVQKEIIEEIGTLSDILKEAIKRKEIDKYMGKIFKRIGDIAATHKKINEKLSANITPIIDGIKQRLEKEKATQK